MDPKNQPDELDKAIETGDFSGIVLNNVSRRISESGQAAKQAEIDAQNSQMSLTNVLKSIPSGIGQNIAHPIKSIKNLAKKTPDMAFGAAEGLYSIGRGLTYLGTAGQVKPPSLQEFEKNAFIDAFVGKGFDYGAAESAWENYMTPEKTDPRGVGEFLSYFVPYAGAENAALKGLTYAAPKFVQGHKILSTILSAVPANIAAGQITESPDATGEERVSRAKWDAALSAVIPFIGPLYRRAKGAIFRKVAKTSLGEKGAIVEPLAEGASKDIQVGGAKPTATVISEDGRMAVSTNNIDAVKNYIKNSGKTNIKIVEKPEGTLGMTREGIPVTANHIFDAKTGTHTFTVTNATSAETIAHEWGHYINDEVAKQVRGLSNYLFGEANTVKNISSIEDTFRAMATKDLVTEGRTIITPDMIDRKMSTLITQMRDDVKKLASLRPEPRKLSPAQAGSERFADAVATVLTNSSAYRNNTLYKFLQTANVVDDQLVQSIRASARSGMRVAPETNKTALELAKERQGAAQAEKMAFGEELPKRPMKPGNRAFEKTAAQKEEAAFAKVPRRTVVRSAEEVSSMIKKNKIPGKNLIEVSIEGKAPVTLVVHEIDKNIMRAIQLGADSRYMEYARRLVMKEFGLTSKQADAYIARRFKELKDFAKSQAEENPVLAKAVRDGAPEAPKGETPEARLELEGKQPEAVSKDGEIISDEQAALEEAEYQILQEMDWAEAGYRLQDPGTLEFRGVPSTFPKWVPEGPLRNKKLFNSVMDLISEGKEPAEKATRQRELYDIVQNMIKERTEQLKTGNRAAAEELAAREESILMKERDLAEQEYNEMFSNGQLDGGYKPGETLPSEPVGLGVADEGPLKVNLDRMETGLKPETPALRAELMAGSPEEEVFLNTKVLPEVTGKFRIKRTNESIIQDALRSDMTEEKFLDILKERVGALTPDVRAGFNIAMEKAKTLRDTLGGRSATELSVEELAKFKNDLGQALQLFETYSGIRTEASNLLRSFGIAVEQGEDDVLRQIFTDLQKAGVASEKDVWRAMAVTHQKLTENPRFQKYLKAWYAAVLSGPATSLRNTVGNLSNAISEVMSAASTPKRWGEVPEMVNGFFRGLSEKGLPDAKAALKGEMGGKFTTPYDPQFPLPEDAFRNNPSTMFDRLTESVGRFLNAQDLAVSAAVREMEKSALKVYKPDISEAVSKALSEMYGLSSVYRGLPKGKAIRATVEATETFTRGWPQGKILIPFIRTIGNVIDRQFDYMPIFSSLRLREGVIMEQARNIAKKYGLSTQDDIRLIAQRLKDQQMGRMYTGLAATAAASTLAAKGLVSGIGPSDYNEKVQLQRTGWRPNSIKIGNVWIPYTYFGPMAGIFSMAGTIHDAVKYDNAPNKSISQLLTKGMIGWGRSQLNMSFLKGTTDLLNVLTGNTAPEKYFEALGTSLIPIPNAYSQSLNMTKNLYSQLTNDPSLRQQYETRGIMDRIRVKLGLTGEAGGLFKALNPKSDMFGTPMTLDLIYGLSPTIDKTDKMPVDAFLVNNGVVVTIPPKNQSFSFRGKDVKMTDDQYSEYVRESGQAIYNELTKKLPAMERLSGEKLQNFVSDIVKRNREKARKEIFSQ